MQKSKTYIYLHGFNSTGQSAKGRYFAKCLAPANVICPTYPHVPDLAINHLIRRIEEIRGVDPNPILIGSSLGGFYAQYLARQFNLAVILINPALQPMLTLKNYLGLQRNYYTREHYIFEQNHLEQLEHYDICEPCQAPTATLLLLDEGDELIDAHVARQRYQACANIRMFPGGNHQFAHLDEAVLAIKYFSDSEL